MELSVSYSFSPTTIIESSQVNQNFADIVNYINNTACVTGMVVAWSGAIVDIPTGWAIDNNLKDRMIIGAGNLYNVDANGGESTHTLSEAEMPQHRHHANSMDAGSSAVRAGGNGGGSGGGYTEYAGSSNAHNNLPPYYAYAYIKKS